MPIYEYRCTSCGYKKDHLQKLSDPVLTDCPECGKSSYAKQLSAAGFQLKGSGWYATDFKGSGSKPVDKSAAPASAGGDAPAAASDANAPAVAKSSDASGNSSGNSSAKTPAASSKTPAASTSAATPAAAA
jgi:putative FmdB family regulatory protein